MWEISSACFSDEGIRRNEDEKRKITVIKKHFDPEIVSTYGSSLLTPCPDFNEGDVFYSDGAKPDHFCDDAWMCIKPYCLMLAHGGAADAPFCDGIRTKDKNTAIACCSDGLRTVVFRIEAVNE